MHLLGGDGIGEVGRALARAAPPAREGARGEPERRRPAARARTSRLRTRLAFAARRKWKRLSVPVRSRLRLPRCRKRIAPQPHAEDDHRRRVAVDGGRDRQRQPGDDRRERRVARDAGTRRARPGRPSARPRRPRRRRRRRRSRPSCRRARTGGTAAGCARPSRPRRRRSRRVRETSSTPSSAGTNPFSVSSRTTGAPSQRPYARQTFVAPMLPLPDARMSSCLISTDEPVAPGARAEQIAEDDEPGERHVARVDSLTAGCRTAVSSRSRRRSRGC